MVTIPIFDRVLKILARDYAESFLRLALPRTTLRLVGVLENVELALPERRVDFIHRLESPGGEEYLLHIEFQTRHEAGLPRRLFVYSALLTEQFGLPVVTLVLYLARRQAAVPEAYEVRVEEMVTNRFTYLVLKLWEYEADIWAGRWPELAPLLVMLAEEPTTEVLARERELILQEPDPGRRADLLACAVSVGARYFDKDFLWRYFRQEVEQMREATFIEEWIEEGIQQGMQRGLQQGAKQAKEETLTRILLRRFGRVPVALGARLEPLEPAQLEYLIDAALDAADMTVFEQTLVRLTGGEETASNPSQRFREN